MHILFLNHCIVIFIAERGTVHQLEVDGKPVPH